MGFVAACIVAVSGCDKPKAGDFSYVRITRGDQIPADILTWPDYNHVWVCPGDQVTVWWNAKGVSPASVTNVPNPPLSSMGQSAIAVPATAGDTVFHLSEGQNIYQGAQDATMTVVGQNGGVFASVTAGIGATDAHTGQPSYSVTVNSGLFSPGVRVKSIKIHETPGVGQVTWQQGSMQDEHGNVFTFQPVETEHTLQLDPGNRPPIRGYWYFSPDRSVRATSIVIIFEVFCEGL
jgi:hypothetical protein